MAKHHALSTILTFTLPSLSCFKLLPFLYSSLFSFILKNRTFQTLSNFAKTHQFDFNFQQLYWILRFQSLDANMVWPTKCTKEKNFLFFKAYLQCFTTKYRFWACTNTQFLSWVGEVSRQHPLNNNFTEQYDN